MLILFLSSQKKLFSELCFQMTFNLRWTIHYVSEWCRLKRVCSSVVIKPPASVTATQTGRGTARITWLPVEDVLLYQVTIRNIDEPAGLSNVYNVTDSKLDVQGILPCSTYLISVSSFNNFLTPSEPTDYTYTTNSESAEPGKYQ